MNDSYYTPHKPGWVMRLLWKASGGDRFLLERSTYSDQLKYMCLGGIIVATGLMAGLAGGYAFYTVFEPKGGNITDVTHLPTLYKSIAFGLFWGLMIFNLDRFIVSSTGKGDGTEKITWSEFTGAIPRLILGAIIAITISTPIELRMFKSEIDVRLAQAQRDTLLAHRETVDLKYDDKIDLLQNELIALARQEDKVQDKIDVLRAEYVEEARIIRPGPKARAVREQMNYVEQELAGLRERNDVRREVATAEITKLESQREEDYNQVQATTSGLDGLLQRISISHDIAPWYITAFIALLFLAIELTPIFFKMMLVKSPYDFMKENVEELIKANQGILVTYDYHTDKQGQERDLVEYLGKDKVYDEQKQLREVQRELVRYAIKKYEEQVKQQIDANPERFIYSENLTNGAGHEA